MLIVLHDWYRFVKFCGPIGISLGRDVLEGSETSSQRGVHPAALKNWVHGP